MLALTHARTHARSTERLAARLRAGEETIAFDKDDDETLDFVTAAANLRSAAYGIASQSRWEVKGASHNSRAPTHAPRTTHHASRTTYPSERSPARAYVQRWRGTLYRRSRRRTRSSRG